MHRRQVVGGAAVLAAGGFLFRSAGLAAQATPGASPAAGGEGLQPDGTWIFTDDRDRVVTVDHLPERIFADIQAGVTLFEFGIAPVGMVGYPGVYEVPAELADLPFLDLEASGNEYDVEAIAQMRPDLSVGITWDVNSKADFGGSQEDQIPGFTDIAPTLCILGVVAPADASIERFRQLAAALGADTETPEIVAAKAEFDAACEAVRTAVAAKPGLKVMAISPAEEAPYIGNPEVASDLVLFKNLGVEFVLPDSPDAGNSGLFQELSWEQVGNYPADLYLVDDRPYSLQSDALAEHPTFSLLPAAQAGQFSSWTVEYVTTYGGLTPLLLTLAEAINASEIVTG